jgi:hypothetical protein
MRIYAFGIFTGGAGVEGGTPFGKVIRNETAPPR